METQRELTPGAAVPETWTAWPVNWSAVWVGALAGLAALVVFGLSGAALGLHLSGPDARIVDWHKVGWAAAACSVASAFFAFVIAGWIAGKIGGYRRSEPAMLHGAIAWLLAAPMILLAAALGGGGYLGNWYGGLGPPAAPRADASAARSDDPDAAKAAEDARVKEARVVARNAALAAVASLLLGLIGSVLGGWMASGEQMTLNHHWLREKRAADGRTEGAGRVLTSV
jgi:hypothetical protein